MSNDTKALIIVVAASLAACAAVVFGLAKLKEAKCHRQWADSGIPVQWGWIQGCRIDPQATGRWIPADVYREVP